MHWILSPDPLAERRPVATRAVAWLAAIVLVHVILAWLLRIPALSWGEDDAAYIQLAQQLRHASYREVHDLVAPIHARFPPGYPALIALIGWPFGDAVDALLALNTLLTVGTIVLLFLTARRHLGESMALLVSGLFAVNPSSVWDSGHVMAESPFKFLMLLGLWALTREDEDPRFAVLAGGATIAAALTRSAGIFLLPALVAYWILHRRYRRAAWLIGASLLTVGAWQAWTILAPDPEQRRLYVADLGVARTQARPRFAFVREIVERIPQRLQRLGTIVFPFVLALPVVRGTLVDNVGWLVVVAVLGGIGTVVMLRRWTSAALITLCYSSLLVIWRYAIERFANPILPFMHASLFVGADWMTRRWAPRLRRPVTVVLTGLLLLGAGLILRPRVLDALACDRARPVESTGCWDAAYRDYLKAAAWVRDSTPPDAVFLVNKERAFYQHTGRRTINQDRALQEDATSLAPYLRARGVRYAVSSRVGIRSEEQLWLLANACRDFVLVRAFPTETLVLRVREAGDDPAQTRACELLAPYRTRRPVRE